MSIGARFINTANSALFAEIYFQIPSILCLHLGDDPYKQYWLKQSPRVPFFHSGILLMAGVKNSGNKGQDTESSYLLSADRRSIRRSSGTECDTTLPKAVIYVHREKKEGKVEERCISGPLAGPQVLSNAETWTVIHPLNIIRLKSIILKIPGIKIRFESAWVQTWHCCTVDSRARRSFEITLQRFF